MNLTIHNMKTKHISYWVFKTVIQSHSLQKMFLITADSTGLQGDLWTVSSGHKDNGHI